MACLLRAAAGALRAGLGSAGSSGARAAAQQQQRRGAHELHAHTNKHVESWLSRREDIEHEFRWNRSNLRAVLLGGILIPIATYNMLVYMAHKGGFRNRGRGSDHEPQIRVRSAILLRVYILIFFSPRH